MKITSDELMRAYKSHIQRRVPASRKGCPSPELILRAFEPSTSSADKAEVVNHVTGCSHCLQEFELWLGFRREQEKALNEIIGLAGMEDAVIDAQGKKAKILTWPFGHVYQIRALWKWAFGLIFAAAITVAVFVGVKSFLAHSDYEERGKLPGQIRLISPVQGLKVRIPFVFCWEGMPDAESYSLEIFDKTLLPLWKSPQIEGLQYELPLEAQLLIKKGEIYFWTMSAWLKDGAKRESPLEEFVLEK